MTGTELKEWRKRLSLTQAGAAEAIGCGRRSIQQWEKGQYPIPRFIALACSAVSMNIAPYGSPANG